MAFSGNFLSRWLTRRKMVKKGLVSQHRRRIEDSPMLIAADQSKILGIFMLILLWGVCSLLLTLPEKGPAESRLIEGQRAPRTVFAEFLFHYPDSAATDAKRMEAAGQEPLYFMIDEAAGESVNTRFHQLFAAVRQRLDDEQNRRNFAFEPGSVGGEVAKLDPKTLALLGALMQNPTALQEFNRELGTLLNGGILSSERKNASKVSQKLRIINRLGHERAPESVTQVPSRQEAAERLSESMLRYYPKDDDRDMIRQTLTSLCAATLGDAGNLTFNRERTLRSQNQAADRVEPVTHEVAKRQPIVTKDQIVDREILDKMTAYERLLNLRESAKNDYYQLFQNVVWSLVLVLFVGVYMYHIHPDIVSSNRRIALFTTIIIASLLIDYGALEIFRSLNATSVLSPNLIIDAVPLALASILLAVTAGFRVALYAGFLVSSICAMLLGKSFDFALEGMMLCAIAALTVRNSTNYRAFFFRAFSVVAGGAVLMNVNVLEFASLTKAALWQDVVVSVCNGLFTALAALVIIFILELLFHVDTNMSLMVLCDYNHPLLERMKREAAGTFFHSMMVATLAEDAALAIHGNPLRAKTGALFHDIGKLSKPQYFTENNLECENQHLDLNPQVSSIIIRDHVKEGLDLARQYHLSRVVRDAIEQHHGNDLVHYFYQKALENSRGSGTPITEAQYRYQGIPPKDKEMAIISLADACEAACRSLEKPTSSKIEALVDEIFRKRFRDGQLNRANLTMAELKTIRDTFVKQLTNMRHGRVSYAKEDDSNENDLFMAKPPVSDTAAKAVDPARRA